jgi:hypothetical protein
MVGSVFSPLQHTGPREVLPPGEISFSSPARSDLRQAPENYPSSISPQKFAPASDQPDPQRTHGSDPVYTPLMPKAEMFESRGLQRQVMTGRQEDLPSHSEERTSSSHPEEETHTGERQGPEPAREIVLKDAHKAIISENTRPTTGQEIPVHKANPLVAAWDARQANSSHHPGSASQEQDEIQIHIGRIEVTAVQQASFVHPQAAKSERRKLSLEEYLRRADGRGR